MQIMRALSLFGRNLSNQPRFMVGTKQEDKVIWSPYGGKHAPSLGVTWKKIVEGTKDGTAKYALDINQEELEREAWKSGETVTNGKPWKVKKFNRIVGAKDGQETQYIRVENSNGTRAFVGVARGI